MHLTSNILTKPDGKQSSSRGEEEMQNLVDVEVEGMNLHNDSFSEEFGSPGKLPERLLNTRNIAFYLRAKDTVGVLRGLHHGSHSIRVRYVIKNRWLAKLQAMRNDPLFCSLFVTVQVFTVHDRTIVRCFSKRLMLSNPVLEVDFSLAALSSPYYVKIMCQTASKPATVHVVLKRASAERRTKGTTGSVRYQDLKLFEEEQDVQEKKASDVWEEVNPAESAEKK